MTHGKRLYLDTWDQSTIPPLSPAQVHSARVFVCEQADDATDAALLLDALGIGRAA